MKEAIQSIHVFIKRAHISCLWPFMITIILFLEPIIARYLPIEYMVNLYLSYEYMEIQRSQSPTGMTEAVFMSRKPCSEYCEDVLLIFINKNDSKNSHTIPLVKAEYLYCPRMKWNKNELTLLYEEGHIIMPHGTNIFIDNLDSDIEIETPSKIDKYINIKLLQSNC